MGDSVASWLRESDASNVRALDPRSVGVRCALRQIPSRGRVVFVYPTKDTKRSIRLVVLLVAARLRGATLALHLHEYSRLHWLHRAIARVLVFLTNGTVVVSTRSESKRVPHRRVVVVPPAAGASPNRRPEVDHLNPQTQVPRISVFGIARPDKGIEQLWQWLALGDGRTTELVLIGSSWLTVDIPAEIQTKYHVERPGFVPTEELADWFGATAVAVAPFTDGATDGRTSLRTPASYGAPIVTRFPDDPADLTLRHGLIMDMQTTSRDEALRVAQEVGPDGRYDLTFRVAAFEKSVIRALDEALLG